MMKSILSLVEKVRQSGASKAGVIVYEGVKRKLMPKLVKRTTVYQLDEEAYRAGPPVRRTEGLIISRHERMPDDLATLLAGVDVELRSSIESVMRREFGRKGVLWLGTIDGALAAVRWSKFGRDVQRWYLPLNPDDVVLFGAQTLEAFKGRGIHSAMIRHVVETETGAGRFLCDIHDWNTVSQRNWLKCGFRPIAPELPINPKFALSE